MSALSSPFQFANYRDFLRAALVERGFSYRSFARKYKEVISFITIAQVLSQGRSGTRNKPLRNLSSESLARLGKILKLSEEEITYLILLKLENDGEVFSGPYGSAYLDSMRAMVRDHKNRQAQSTIRDNSVNNLSNSSFAAAELLDLLPDSAKRRLLKEILLESKSVRARHNRKAGVKALSVAMERLQELSS